MALVAVANGQATDQLQLNQIINLLTGVMTDQDVTLAKRLAVGALPAGHSAIPGDIIVNRGGVSPGTATIYFGSSTGAHYLYFNGSQYQLTDDLVLAGNLIEGVGKYVQVRDSSLTPNKFITATGGQLGIANNTFAVWILLLDDNGVMTLRNAINVPPSVGGTMAATSYGTIPVKIAEATPGGTAQFVFSAIPQTFRHLLIEFAVKGDLAASLYSEGGIRFNSDAAANYAVKRLYNSGTTYSTTDSSTVGLTYAGQWYMPAGNSIAGRATTGRLYISAYREAFIKHATMQWMWSPGTGFPSTGLLEEDQTDMFWNSTAAITSITIFPAGGGNFLAGSVFTLYGIP